MSSNQTPHLINLVMLGTIDHITVMSILRMPGRRGVVCMLFLKSRLSASY